MASSTGGSGKPKVLNLKPQPSYTIPRPKAFARLYKEEIKSEIDEEYDALVVKAKEEGCTVELKLVHYNRRCSEMYDEATDEVKAKVEEYINELKEEGATITDDDGDAPAEGGDANDEADKDRKE